MNSDEQARAASAQFLRRELVRAHSSLVFQDVIHILALHAAKPDLREAAAAERVLVPADLEVDEVRPAIVAEENVGELVRIDISDAAAMQLTEQVLKLREKSVGHARLAIERAAADEAVDESGFANAAQELGNVRHVGEGFVDACFAPAKPSPQPLQRDADEVFGAPELDDDEIVRIIGRGIETGGGVEVVLDRAAMQIRSPADDDPRRKIIPPQRAQRIRWPLAVARGAIEVEMLPVQFRVCRASPVAAASAVLMRGALESDAKSAKKTKIAERR